jgi:hypothetical protein
MVLKCVYKINIEEQIESSLKWEHGCHFKNLKDIGTTVLCTYLLMM